jgi:catecholate siderophore receptor
VRHVGKRNLTSEDQAKLDAYWVHDAMLGYRASDNLELQLNLSNLTDRKYVERVRTVIGSDTRSSAVEYGDGRAAVLSSVYRF